MIKDKSVYITTNEAAELLGFKSDYIRRLISNGKIKAKKLGPNYIIKPADLKKIKRTRFKRERKENGISK